MIMHEPKYSMFPVFPRLSRFGSLCSCPMLERVHSVSNLRNYQTYALNPKPSLRNAPTVVYMDYALAFAIFSYTLIVGISLVATFSSFTDAFRLVAVVIGCFAGPVISLLLKIRASGEADEVAALMKMVPADFKRFIVGSEDARSPGSSWVALEELKLSYRNNGYIANDRVSLLQ